LSNKFSVSGDTNGKPLSHFWKGSYSLNNNQEDKKNLTQDKMHPGESNSETPPLSYLSEEEKKKLQVKDGQNNLNVDERGGF
jgi:hypothetical protein